MAQFRNVSGSDRHLALPDWYDHRLVEAGEVIDVDDAIADKYEFDPDTWEPVTETKSRSSKKAEA